MAKDSLLEMLLEQYRQLDKEQQDEIEFAKELLKNNVGILIKDRNKEEMAKEIIKLLKSKGENKYSEKGYKYCQKYLITNVKKEWISILK